MVRMNDPYPKGKCPAKWPNKFLGFDPLSRTPARVVALVDGFAGRARALAADPDLTTEFLGFVI